MASTAVRSLRHLETDAEVAHASEQDTLQLRYMPAVKLVVIGASGVGKTSLRTQVRTIV
jgi:GTPase SAR1 family protein